MEAMWSKLKTQDVLFLPIFGLESLNESLRTKGHGNVKAPDVKASYLYVQQEDKGVAYDFLCVYSDMKIMKDGTSFTTASPVSILEKALYDPNADSLYFNPKSRACDESRYACGINRLGLPEIIGFLQASDVDEGRPFHELAVEACAQKKWYLVQYFLAMSRREGRSGDDWKKAELAKFRSWYELNFPGVRERALGELEWFITTYGDTDEAEALRADFKKNADTSSRNSSP